MSVDVVLGYAPSSCHRWTGDVAAPPLCPHRGAGGQANLHRQEITLFSIYDLYCDIVNLLTTKLTTIFYVNEEK